MYTTVGQLSSLLLLLAKLVYRAECMRGSFLPKLIVLRI
jgi:hypothetical protein